MTTLGSLVDQDSMGNGKKFRHYEQYSECTVYFNITYCQTGIVSISMLVIV